MTIFLEQSVLSSSTVSGRHRAVRARAAASISLSDATAHLAQVLGLPESHQRLSVHGPRLSRPEAVVTWFGIDFGGNRSVGDTIPRCGFELTAMDGFSIHQ